MAGRYLAAYPCRRRGLWRARESLRERPSLPTSLSRSVFFVWGISRDKTRSQTRYFEAPPMTGATIYPDRDQLVVELAVGGGIAALVGFILLDTAWEALFGNGLGDIGGVAATAAFVFVILIIFPPSTCWA